MVSVDQVGANLCANSSFIPRKGYIGVRRSGWCQPLRRSPERPSEWIAVVSVDQVGANLCTFNPTKQG